MWTHASAVRSACVILSIACGCSIAHNPADDYRAADTALQRGQLSEALALADAGIAGAAPESVWAWTFRLLRSDVLLESGNVTDALPALTASLPNAPDLAPLRARQTYLRAKAERNQGKLEEALRTLESVDRALPPDDPVRLSGTWLRGQVELRLGRSGPGEARLIEVANRAASARQRPLQGLAYLDLGMSRLMRGRYDEALGWLERVPTFKELDGTTVLAKALNNAAICYGRLGLFDRAVQAHEQAIALQRASGAVRPLSEALGSLGNTYVLRGDARSALARLREAYDVAASARLDRDAALWAGNLAAAHAQLGDWDEADRFNELSRTLDGDNSVVKASTLVLSAAEVAKGRGDLSRSRDLYTQALAIANGTPTVEWTAQYGLAQIALRENDPATASRHFESALMTVEATRSDLLKADYRLSFLNPLIAFYQAYVDALVDQGRSDRALEIADSSRGRVLAERQRVAAPARGASGVASFQRTAARTRTTILSYWLAPARSFLWVITGQTVRRIDLPPAAEIEVAVRAHQTMVNNSLADPLAQNGTPGDRLYQMLVAPAALPHGASVVIVPDGALHGINFETLPVDGAVRRYWIADAQVQVAPSLAMLTDERPRPRDTSPRLLLIGNPTPRPPEFPALSYAPAEMTSIVRHFAQDRVTAFDSDRATPAAYQAAALDRFSMIHFTAHATANVESPLDSAVVLSGPDTEYKLYARDVADRPLTADLVTVSACRSAGERAYSGEGLVGFAWAFLRAGARRVVAGLWDVDDRSTARLMDTLYGGVDDGLAPAAALRAAKLALIASGGQLARPYYWGPFQLFTVAP